MARIVTLGSALQNIYLVDNTLALEKIVPNSSSSIGKICYTVGGNGINAAVTFARHNHETIFIGNIGKDIAGESVLRILDQENIDSSYVEFASRKSTGTSIILLNSKNHEYTTLVSNGVATEFANFTADDLNLIHPDWLYITTLNGDISSFVNFAAKAKSLGAKIAFNPGAKELTKDLLGNLKFIDVLILNKHEAAKLVPGSTLIELITKLNGYVETVAITAGSMGGIAANRREVYRFGIYEDIPIKDIFGVGDAFGSGLVAHLASGKSLYRSLIFASANATAVAQQIGTTAGILTGKEPLHPMPIQKL